MDRLNGFSIIMPAFNASATIADAIESVLEQSFCDFELLVVNDASTDNTAEIVESYIAKDNRIRFFNLSENKGVAHARNVALKNSRFKYIAFLDSDDLWLPFKLELQVSLLDIGNDVVYGDYVEFDSMGNERRIYAPGITNYRSMLFGNVIGNLTGAYNAEKLGVVLQSAIGHEDYLMWLQILEKCESAVSVGRIIGRYRISGSSLSANKLNAARWMWRIYRDQLKLGFSRASFYFISYAIKAILKRRSGSDKRRI